MQEITISVDMLLGLGIGVAVPALLWAFKMFSMLKQTRDMHLEPDEYGFGSCNLEALLKEEKSLQSDQHREYIESITALRYAFKELSHFMRWMVKERTGKEPPPYVRRNGD